MRVEILRHGKTILQERKAYQGMIDVPLSEEGKNELVRTDPSVDLVYVTNKIRTKETAKILFPNARQIEIDGLEEMNFGEFEGKNYQELTSSNAYREWVEGNCEGKCPKGESKKEFTQRIIEAFDMWMQSLSKETPEHVILVAHGGTQMAIMEKYAVPHKAYFDWQVPCAVSYSLSVDDWNHSQQLKLMETIDYTKVD